MYILSELIEQLSESPNEVATISVLKDYNVINNVTWNCHVATYTRSFPFHVYILFSITTNHMHITFASKSDRAHKQAKRKED